MSAISKANPLKPSKVCMLAYTFYETDGRVMRYAEALQQDGMEVEAIVLRRQGQSDKGELNGVKILRIQERVKNETGKFSYLWRIGKFFVCSMIHITSRHLKEPYQLIHVHSVPDFEVFAAVVPKLLGAKIILDIHDIMPEFYAAKFKVGEQSLIFKVLKWVEKLSTGFADHVIIANDLWRNKLTHRSVPPNKCSSFINYPDLTTFSSSLKKPEPNDKFTMIYPGTLNWHQGLDLAITAFAKIKSQIPKAELHIYGEGPTKPELQEQVERLDLTNQVFLHSPKPIKEIAAIMANADVGVVPKRNDGFGGDAFSTKIMEFMALGVPVLAARTRVDQYYFNEDLLNFFCPGDSDDLAAAMLNIYQNPQSIHIKRQRAEEFAQDYSWDRKKTDYLKLVKQLLGYQLYAS